MAGKNLSVKFTSEGYQELLNQLKTLPKSFEGALDGARKTAQEIIKDSAQLTQGTKEYEAAQKSLAATARKETHAIAGAFRELGVRSGESINAQKMAAISAFEAIKKAGQSSADEILRARQSLNQKLKALDEQLKPKPGESPEAIKLKELETAYQKLGVVSNASYEEQKKQAKAAFEEIKNSGKASLDELMAARLAYNAKVKAIDSQQTANSLDGRKKQRELEEEAQKIKLIQDSYGRLSLVSRESLQAQRATAIAAFEAIKNSGVASAREIRQAESLLKQELKAIEAQLHPLSSAFKNYFTTLKVGNNDAVGGFTVLKGALANILSSAAIGGFQALTGAVVNLAKSSIDAGATLERQMVAFEVFTGSAEKAKKVYKDIFEFAKTTPFQLPEVTEAAKQLLAVKTPIDELIPTLKMLGDISAGADKPLSQLLFVYNQVKNQGVAYGQDINQLFNAGLSMSDLAKSLGKTEEELGKAKRGAQGLQITFEDLQKIIKDATSEGGRFYGMIDKLGGTTAVKISNLEDSFTKIYQSIYAGISPAISGMLDLLVKTIDPLSENKEIWKDLNAQAVDFKSYLDQNPKLANDLNKALTEGVKVALDTAAGIAKNLLGYLQKNPTAIADAVKQLDFVIQRMGEFVRLISLSISGWEKIAGYMKLISGGDRVTPTSGADQIRSAGGTAADVQRFQIGLDKIPFFMGNNEKEAMARQILEDVLKDISSRQPSEGVDVQSSQGVIVARTGGALNQDPRTRGRSTGPHLHAQARGEQITEERLKYLVDKYLDLEGKRASDYGTSRGSKGHGYLAVDYKAPQGTPIKLKNGAAIAQFGPPGGRGGLMAVISTPEGRFQIGHLTELNLSNKSFTSAVTPEKAANSGTPENKIKLLPEVEKGLSDLLKKFNSKMTPEDFAFVSQKTGVSLDALVTQSMIESGFGTTGRGAKFNNPLNWGNDDVGNNKGFPSLRDGLFAGAKGLKENFYFSTPEDFMSRGFMGKYGIYATDPNYKQKYTAGLNLVRRSLGENSVNPYQKIAGEIDEKAVKEAEKLQEQAFKRKLSQQQQLKKNEIDRLKQEQELSLKNIDLEIAQGKRTKEERDEYARTLKLEIDLKENSLALDVLLEQQAEKIRKQKAGDNSDSRNYALDIQALKRQRAFIQASSSRDRQLADIQSNNESVGLFGESMSGVNFSPFRTIEGDPNFAFYRKPNDRNLGQTRFGEDLGKFNFSPSLIDFSEQNIFTPLKQLLETTFKQFEPSGGLTANGNAIASNFSDSLSLGDRLFSPYSGNYQALEGTLNTNERLLEITQELGRIDRENEYYSLKKNENALKQNEIKKIQLELEKALLEIAQNDLLLTSEKNNLSEIEKAIAAEKIATLTDTKGAFDDLGQSVNDLSQGAFANFFESALIKTGEVKNAFADMVQSILQGISQIAARMATTELFKLLGLAGNTGGGDLLSLGSAISYNGDNISPFSGIFSSLGFADGGYTGNGGKYDPAGIVHKGEFVFPQASVKSLGVGLLNQIASTRKIPTVAIPVNSGNSGGITTINNKTLNYQVMPSQSRFYQEKTIARKTLADLGLA